MLSRTFWGKNMAVQKHQRRSRKKRRNYFFKKGNAEWQKRSCPGDNPHSEVPGIVRPSLSVFEGISFNSGEDNSRAPMLLRPRKAEKKSEDFNKGIGENVIIRMEKMNELMQIFLDKHDFIKCSKPESKIKTTKRLGLGVVASIECKNCRFKTKEFKLYEEGPNGKCKLNTATALPMLKTKMGPADVRFFLGALNIKPPSTTLLYKILNHAADIATTLNQESMDENQNYVARVQDMKGQGNLVDLEVDTSYNNRIQSGYEAGTMSITPAVECSTGRKLVMALNICNKLSKASLDSPSSSQSYPKDKSIVSSEAFSTVKNIESIHGKNVLTVRSVTSDQSAQIEKAIRDVSVAVSRPIQHYYCFVHRLRTLQKRLISLNLKSFLTGYDSKSFTKQVARAIRSRIYFEIVRLNKTVVNRTSFSTKVKLAVNNVVPCLTGDHTQCSRASVFCRKSVVRRVIKDLPHQEYLVLTPNDQEKLTVEIKKFFDEANTAKIQMLKNTNKAESIHHRCFTVAPKNTSWVRNFAGLCHSAVHCDTHNRGTSTSLLASRLGLSFGRTDPFTKFMSSVDRVCSYDKERQKKYQYKKQRYLCRLRKCNRKLFENSLYTNGQCTTSTQIEHSYAISTCT